jgi:hypothetical protein
MSQENVEIVRQALNAFDRGNSLYGGGGSRLVTAPAEIR